MAFELATPARILFGPGTVVRLGGLASELGRRALVVTGRSADRAERVAVLLADASVGTSFFSVRGEPTIDAVREGTEAGRARGCDLVIAFGGGSAIDAGKAIAGMLGNPGDPLDYIEVIGKGSEIARPGVPFVAVPTTAGTGSEVTRNAVLGSPEHGVKASLRSLHLLARVAIVDPDLLASLPRAVVAQSGLDALCQLIEPFVSTQQNLLTDGFAREGMKRSARSLRKAYELGPGANEREDLAAASLLGGLCLANAGLGAVHGFAAPIGGMFNAPHGAVCAALLPAVVEVNRRALAARAPGSRAIARYDEVAQLLVGRCDATFADGARWIRDLCGALAVASLRAYGVGPGDVRGIVEKAKNASSMKANPIVLTDDELVEIVERSA